jgi:hypothetical protein
MAANLVREKPDGYGALPALLSRQIKLLTAEIEFLKELRQELDEWDRARAAQRATAETASTRDTVSSPAIRPSAKRQKGTPRT